MNKQFFMITLLASCVVSNVSASVMTEVKEFVAPTHVDVTLTARVKADDCVRDERGNPTDCLEAMLKAGNFNQLITYHTTASMKSVVTADELKAEREAAAQREQALRDAAAKREQDLLNKIAVVTEQKAQSDREAADAEALAVAAAKGDAEAARKLKEAGQRKIDLARTLANEGAKEQADAERLKAKADETNVAVAHAKAHDGESSVRHVTFNK